MWSDIGWEYADICCVFLISVTSIALIEFETVWLLVCIFCLRDVGNVSRLRVCRRSLADVGVGDPPGPCILVRT